MQLFHKQEMLNQEIKQRRREILEICHQETKSEEIKKSIQRETSTASSILSNSNDSMPVTPLPIWKS